MSGFPLKIVTPDGLKFDGIAQSLTVRTTTGDMGFLAGHRDCIAPLGMGRATVVVDGEKRYAACIGGMMSMVGGKATLVPTTFEWAGDIDLPRAQRSQARAEARLREKGVSGADIKLAEARLRRALVRQSVAQGR